MALPRCVILSIRYGLGRKPGRSHERSPGLGSALSLPLSPAPCWNPERRRQELGVETTTSLVGNGANQRSGLQGPGSAKLWTASQNSKEGAVTDRRTARDTSVRLDRPRMHQQSHEGTGGAAPRRALLIVAGTGLQLSSHGARALELIPPVRSAP